jgi:VCBS repeat-containing protein
VLTNPITMTWTSLAGPSAFERTGAGMVDDYVDTTSESVTVVGPELTIDDVTVDEGAGTAAFTVTLSAASPFDIDVDYATSDGTAVDPDDYTGASDTLTIPANSTVGYIVVPIIDDGLYEYAETFTVTLTQNSPHVYIGDDEGIGTITNDDRPPILTIADVTVDEGAGTATLTVTQSAVSGVDTDVDYATYDDTAVAPGDYTAIPSTTLTIPAGSTEGYVVVTIIDDALDEDAETFTVMLGNPVNASIADRRGVGTITDDDPLPSLTISDVTVDEPAGTATFTVTLSPVSGRAVSVEYATYDGTAVAPGDYGAIATTTLTITAGTTTEFIVVTIVDDAAPENTEQFTVSLGNPVNVTLTDNQAIGTIIDDDNTPPVAVDDYDQTDEDTLLSVPAPGVLGNDWDADMDSLTVTAYLNPSVGGAIVNVNPNGSLTFDPTAVPAFQALAVGEEVVDTFVYTITDGTDIASATVHITVTGVNDDPILSGVMVSSPIDENGTVALTGDIADVDTSDALSLTVDWGDGTVDVFGYPVGTTAITETHQYLDDDPSGTPSDVYIVGLTLEDAHGGVDTDSASVIVNNLDPYLSNLDVAPVIGEGGFVTLTGELGDVGTLDTFTLTVDWGDGDVEVFTYPAGTTAFTEMHQYLDDDPSGTPSDSYTVTVTLMDDDGGMAAGEVLATVMNVAPEVYAGPDQVVKINVSVSFSGVITDPGVLDTHTVEWDFGDGVTATGSLLPSHVYTRTGDFTVTLTVTDDDGGVGQDTLVVTVDLHYIFLPLFGQGPPAMDPPQSGGSRALSAFTSASRVFWW